MRKHKLIYLPVLTSLLAVSTAHAQLNLPNPLIEPQLKGRGNFGEEQRPGSGARGVQGPGSLPPLPSESALGRQASGTDGGSTLNTIRSQFAGFAVSAIVGDRAILRRAAGANAAGAGPTPVSQMSNGQIPMASSPGGIGSTSSSLRSETLTLKDGERVDYGGVDGDLTAKIKNGKVVIYLDSMGKKVAVFAGEVEGTIVQSRTITLQNKDADYRNAINVKASGAASQGSSTSGSSSGPGQGAPSQPSQNGSGGQ